MHATPLTHCMPPQHTSGIEYGASEGVGWACTWWWCTAFAGVARSQSCQGGQDTRVHWQQLQVYVQRDCMFSLKAHDSQHPTHRLGTGGHCSAVQQASLPRATTCTGKPSRLVQTLHRPPLQHYDDMPRLIMRLHKLNFLRLDQCFCFRVCSFVFRLFQRNEYLFSFSWKSCNFKFRQCWTCFNRFRALLENIRSSCLISRGVDRPKSPEI